MSIQMAPADSIERSIVGRWYAVFGVEPRPGNQVRVVAYRDNYRTEAGAKRYITWLKLHVIGRQYSAGTKFYTAVVEATIKDVKPI